LTVKSLTIIYLINKKFSKVALDLVEKLIPVKVMSYCIIYWCESQSLEFNLRLRTVLGGNGVEIWQQAVIEDGSH